MTQLVTLGGSDAGISAALRARELDPTSSVRLVVADRFPNYSLCGLPFFLSGETPHWESLARRYGFEPLTVATMAPDHEAYYPGATPLHLRVTGDRRTGKLLGAQLVGSYGAEVSKRIDVFAAALFHGMTVESVCDLDLSYTPPLSSPWDPVEEGCMAWARTRQARGGDR